MRTARFAGALAAVSLATASPASAQLFQLVPKIGAFTPLSDLGEFSGSTRELQGSLALGLAAELKLPILPRLRAGFDSATDTKISVAEGVGEPGSGGTTLLAFTGDIVLRGGGLGPVAPYLLLGGGVKRYNFSEGDFSTISFGSVTDPDRSDLAAHIGGGLDFGVAGIGLRIEATDYISRFEAPDGKRTQHDLFAMLGLSVGF